MYTVSWVGVGSLLTAVGGLKGYIDRDSKKQINFIAGWRDSAGGWVGAKPPRAERGEREEREREQRSEGETTSEQIPVGLKE